MVTVCIVAVVAATAFWTVQRRALEQAERAFLTHAEAGYAALETHDFATAAREFETAVEALKLLRRDDPKARHVRQMLRESIAAADLVSPSLVEILLRLGEEPALDPAEVEREFERESAGRWIVVDAVVGAAGDRAGAGGAMIEYPLLVAGRPVVLSADLDVFRKVSFEDGPRRLVFAVQLQSCRLQSAPPHESWVIGLRSDTAFLWTDYRNYRALGFDVRSSEGDSGPSGEVATEQEVRRLLSEQARVMGVSGEW